MTMINLTMDDKAELALRAKEELARRNYVDYFSLANPKSKLFAHTKYICEKMQQIIDGERKFYIVEMPPQHGKSMTITQTFPSYYLMRHPDKRVMISAYSQDLFTTFSDANRKHFEEWAYPLFGLQPEKNTSKEFHVKDHRGTFYATSMLGGASGRPADLLIIDDPIKNSEEAMSTTIKDKIWNEWNLTFFPRLQKGGSVIVIMTRWQIDDLAGRLMKKKSLPWEELKLPAIAEDIPNGETDEIGRHNGDALCPQLHTIDSLKIHKHDMGSQKFAALYQQRPSLAAGNIFKRDWVKYYVPTKKMQAELQLTTEQAMVLPLHFTEKVQSWDATFKSKENDDFVAGEVWGKRDANYFLLDWRHARMTFTETIAAITTMTAKHPDARSKYIEDKANGSAIIDTLKNKIEGIIPVEPDGGKEVRASAVSPLWEAGNVYVPHPLWKPEIEEMLEEIFNFPNGPHDDWVDAMTQALNYMGKQKSFFEVYKY